MPVFYSQHSDLILCMLSCLLLFSGITALGIGREKSLSRPLPALRYVGAALVILAAREWLGIFGVSQPSFVSFYPLAAVMHTAAAVCILIAALKESPPGSPVRRNVNILLVAVCVVTLALLLKPYASYGQYLAEQKSLIDVGMFFFSKSAPFIMSLVLLAYTLKSEKPPSRRVVFALAVLCLHCLLIALSHPPGIPRVPGIGDPAFNLRNTVIFLLRALTALGMGLILWNIHSRALGVIRQIRWWPVFLLLIFLAFATMLVLASAHNHRRIVHQNLRNSAANAANAIHPADLWFAADYPGAANTPDTAYKVFGHARKAGFFQGYAPLRIVVDALSVPASSLERPAPVLDIAANPGGGRWNPADEELRNRILATEEPTVFEGDNDLMTPTVVSAPIRSGDGKPAGMAVMSVSGMDLAREQYMYKRGFLLFIPLAFLIFLLLFSALQRAWLASHSSSRSEAIRLGALGNDLTGVLITREGVIVDCNQRLLNMMRLERDDVIGVPAESAFSLVDESSVAHWRSLVDAEDPSGNASFVTAVRRRDGSVVDLLVFGRSLAGVEGEPDHCIWESVDITRQKEMEKELRLSRDLLQLALDTLPVGVFLKDADGAYRMVNKAFYDVLGLPSNAPIIGRKTADFLPEAAHEDWQQDQIALDKKGGTVVYEHPIKIGDGLRYFDVSKTVTNPDDGSDGQLIVGCLHDFTTRKEAEDASRGERHFLLQLINALPLSMCFTDHDRIIRICDRDFANEAGVAGPADLVGKHYDDIAPYGPIYFHEDDKALAKRGGTSDLEFELRKDNRRRNFIVRRIAMQDQDGKVLGLLKAFWDTTDLVAANHAAKKAERAKAAFLANMSHELRTPMNGIVGMADLIIDHESTEPLQRLHAETIIKSAKTLQMVMDEVMDVATLDDARQKIRLAVAPFPLLALTEEAAQIVSCIIESWGAQLFLSYDFGLKSLYQGDARHIRQIIVQILTHCSRITSDKRLQLEVADAGNGMVALRVVFSKAADVTADEIEAMFKRPSEQDKSGSQFNIGMFDDRIGLPLAWRLVDAMNGRLTITSSGNVVTCETLLPLPPDPKGAGDIGTPSSLKNLDIVVATNSADSSAAASACLEYAGSRVVRTSTREETAERLGGLMESRGGARPILLFDSGLVPEHKLESFLQEFEASALYHNMDVLLLISSRQVQNMQNLPANVKALVLPPICPTDIWYKVDSLMQMRTGAGAGEGGKRPSSKAMRRPSDRLTRQIRIPAKVLLVEDNTVNQMVVRGLLKRIGCESELAKNGQEALDILESGKKFDLILMDCMMPVMDGYEATARIRRGERGEDGGGGRRNTIIALTANNVAGDRERCLAAGMDAYLTKPVTLDILRDAISRYRPDLVTYVDGIS